MNKLKLILYVSAVLLIAIPTLIVFISDASFSSTTSNTIITISIVFIVLGKVINIVEKKKENNRIAIDIGVIVGLAIVILLRWL
ncbi:hypothetical protein [Ornithinibacillus californiensis]|uniref:hypothetical protein n=1 Tax=Ornithinibacillus californiensis TaxID=161536 RepID=UPI00064DFC2D|nr:hypothetical protein [Ornithinibacillus californiensis]